MKGLRTALERLYRSDACARGMLFALRHFFYHLPIGIFQSERDYVLWHPRPCYPVHALVVPRRRVYAFYNLEGAELDSALRDGLRAARFLPWSPTDREALIFINGGRFQTFAQAHFHIFARKAPSAIMVRPVRRGDGFCLCECTREGAAEPDLLMFTAESDLCARFTQAFYTQIMPAYDLEARGYSIYASVPLPASTDQEISALYVRIGARSKEGSLGG